MTVSLSVPRPLQETHSARIVVVVVLGFAALVVSGVAVVAPQRFGVVLSIVALGLVAAASGLGSPLIAVVYLLVADFFRLVFPDHVLPTEPFILAFVGLVASVGIWASRRRQRLPAIGLMEVFIALYILWNIGSMVAPHLYGSNYPVDGTSLSVPRFILIGAAMPQISLLLGIIAFGRERAIKVLLVIVMLFSAYSALVSILQFYAPSLVWPRYIVDATRWPGRAVGVFNQPVVNGLVLVLGYLAAVLTASWATERRTLRIMAVMLAVACTVGIYLTHTRAAWLSFAIVVVLGILLARGWRKGFVFTFTVVVLAVAVNWSTFTSSDRDAGGVGSTNEVYDRLNMIATSLWALREKPFFGWGIGRFAVVNTYHHQQWSPSIPWNRGYGLASHFDILGIAVELGLIGVSLWILAMAFIVKGSLRAAKMLPDGRMCDRPFALFALLALLTLLMTGLTVDLRFFDFPNVMVLLCVGAAIGRARGASPGQPGVSDLAPSRVQSAT